MPSSTNAGKNKIAKWLNGVLDKNSSVLDLGCGRGTYGRLITKPCFKVAVDAVDYSEKFELLKFYNIFYQHDIRDIKFLKKLGHFSIAILGDVLEHVYCEDAKQILSVLEEQCSKILVAVPYRYLQWGLLNHYENHLQPDLTPEIFKQRYPEFELFSMYTNKQPPWNGGPYYGYYIWEKQDGSTKN